MDPIEFVRTTQQDAVQVGSLLITAEAMQPSVRGARLRQGGPPGSGACDTDF